VQNLYLMLHKVMLGSYVPHARYRRLFYALREGIVMQAGHPLICIPRTQRRLYISLITNAVGGQTPIFDSANDLSISLSLQVPESKSHAQFLYIINCLSPVSLEWPGCHGHDSRSDHEIQTMEYRISKFNTGNTTRLVAEMVYLIPKRKACKGQSYRFHTFELESLSSMTVQQAH